MFIRFMLTLCLASLLAGCCATGADDTLFNQQETRINLPAS